MINLKENKLRVVTSWSEYKIDPRYFVLLFLASFTIGGQFYLDFYQKWDAVITSVSVTVLTEIILTKIFHKKWNLFPISAVITGMGVGLLVSSYLLWVYALTAFISIFLKFVIKFKKGHIFNPNNVAVVLVLFFLQEYAVSTPKQWSNGYLIMAVILCLGLIATYLANRLDVVLTFLGGFTVFGLFRHFVLGAPLFAAIGPLFGAGLQLFAFFMITDPKSTPTTRKSRIIFALLVAFVDAVFRVYRIPNPQFYALFVISLLTIIPFRIWVSKKINHNKIGEVEV
ncbi:RnfABCDGE type electron transport complex subunit D [Bacillus sp. SM2101]|uniref:RnfABCDGE type electron transport complex subunit D n=1 Tax=Bacillus sp. SM2101 TaxID=2805366 RepID=UPI001BDE1D70|nr:RnfABCDGE type electron transport complex subunit D [Bacillus sp. SM2101]